MYVCMYVCICNNPHKINMVSEPTANVEDNIVIVAHIAQIHLHLRSLKGIYDKGQYIL